MRRRELLKYAGATAVAAPFIRAGRADAKVIKVGVVGAKTGPLAPGAAATFFPPWRLWAHEVNQAGGLKLKDGPHKVELVEYDDHTQPPEAIKAVERLVTVDKADWIVGLYSTGFNVAAVPTFARLGYPQIPVACVTDLGAELVKKNPRLFFANGTITQYSSAVIAVLKKLREGGQIGNKVAMVNVADEYGIESANLSKKLFAAAGFDLVYDKSYPLGTQDYAPVIKAAKAANPDTFIAYSYPPDTFGLTDQAKIENFNVKVYYNGIGCAFAGFYGKYSAAAENVIGFGGIPDNEKTRAFLKLFKEVTGIDSDYNACPYFYANGQVLTQAFEGAGTIDRDAVTAYLKGHTFKTLIGEIDLRSQLQNIAYTVGQWQNGFFHSVAAVGAPDSELVPVRVKTGWA
ncbi:MAG: amino acid ABC transporter substrate-binding protein [Xanthobacteraceae bacterium]